MDLRSSSPCITASCIELCAPQGMRRMAADDERPMGCTELLLPALVQCIVRGFVPFVQIHACTPQGVRIEEQAAHALQTNKNNARILPCLLLQLRMCAAVGSTRGWINFRHLVSMCQSDFHPFFKAHEVREEAQKVSSPAQGEATKGNQRSPFGPQPRERDRGRERRGGKGGTGVCVCSALT
jgi:hypothetical protein